MKMKATIGEYSSLDIPITLIVMNNESTDYSVFDNTNLLNIQYISVYINALNDINQSIYIDNTTYKIE